MAAINFTSLRSLPVLYPSSLEVQSDIASIISDMDEELNIIEEKLEKYRQIKTGMMQNLLTGKIRLV